MGNTVANVLVGVAALAIRQPNDAVAEWSAPGYGGESRSAKLTKKGTGSAGSTHVQFIPPAGITLSNIVWTEYGFFHNAQTMDAPVNWCHMEFRFEDPTSEAYVELTAMPCQSEAGVGSWQEEDLTDDTPSLYYGVGESGTVFEGTTLAAINTNSDTNIKAEEAVTDPDDWVLTRIRIELWEPTPARYVYIGEVEIAGTSYEVSPGGSAPGMSLSSPFTDVGYTEDGVTFDYSVDTADIEVEEESFPVDRVITKETLAITCNMAESSLYNIDKAIAGSVLSGSMITIGDGVLKTMSLRIKGTNPAGYAREIIMPLATATGAVAESYKKGEKTVVPVTFQALKPSEGDVCTIVDNVA